MEKGRTNATCMPSCGSEFLRSSCKRLPTVRTSNSVIGKMKKPSATKAVIAVFGLPHEAKLAEASQSRPATAWP